MLSTRTLISPLIFLIILVFLAGTGIASAAEDMMDECGMIQVELLIKQKNNDLYDGTFEQLMRQGRKCLKTQQEMEEDLADFPFTFGAAEFPDLKVTLSTATRLGKGMMRGSCEHRCHEATLREMNADTEYVDGEEFSRRMDVCVGGCERQSRDEL